MKTIIIRFFLTVLIICTFSSCELLSPGGKVNLPGTSYILAFRFQDVSGNDLVEGIGYDSIHNVNSDLYTLDIVFPEPCNNFNTDIFNFPVGVEPDNNFPKLNLNNSNGYFYLMILFSLPTDDCPAEKTVTYKLKCPYIFGDDNVHGFVAYWNFTKISENDTRANCYRVEFEGQEYTIISTEVENNMYSPIPLATIILNK